MGGVSIFPNFDGLPQVNTIATGVAGSGRLLDRAVPTAGRTTIVFVRSVRDFFRWEPTSTATADNLTVCNPTANGVAAGRFLRMNLPAAEWMQQLNWTIDSAAGSDENVGSAASPIKTDAERQRRMGPAPLWNGGEYHIRYLSDVPSTDPVRFTGMRAPNSNIFLHGSATDGQGQSTLFAGAITALTTLDNSTAGATHSWELTAASLPVSWTASGLVNRRIRMTSGASLGAKSFAIVDLGAKKARCDEFLAKNTYTFPFNFLVNTKAPPSNGDTFVVERLTSIVSFYWNVQEVDDGTLNVNFNMGCVESLALGVDSAGNAIGDFVVQGCSSKMCFDGCMVVWFGEGLAGTLFFGSTGIYGFMLPGAWQNVLVSGGHYKGTPGNVNLGLSASALFMEVANNFIFELSGGGIMYVQCFCQLFDFAIFDSAGAFRVVGPRVEFRGKFWGTGNTGRLVDFAPGTQSIFDVNAQFNVTTSATPEFGFLFAAAARTSIPAFDVATNTYTADRTATVAHLTATIAGGGFNNSMRDPVSGAALVKT